MKKLILSLALLGNLIVLSHAGGISISLGSSWDRCARPVYQPVYRPVYYYDNYDRCAPAVIYRPYPIYYSRPYYYQRPIYGYAYPNSYHQGFRDGYSTAVRQAVPVFRAEHSNRVYR